MNKTTAILSAIIFLLLLTGIGYFVLQNLKLTNQLEKSPQPQTKTSTNVSVSSITSPIVQSSPSPKTLTLDDVHKTIITSTSQKDHSVLLPLIKLDNVNFIVMSSGCCSPKTPTEAIDS